MDQDKLFQLLGAIVEANHTALKQNAKALQQNREFLQFIQKRDAAVSSRHDVELEKAKLELEAARIHNEELRMNLAAYEQLGVSRKQMITEAVGLNVVKHKTAMLNAKADSDYAEERVTREAKKLEKTRNESSQ